jgi:hypothetical protein
MKKTLSIIALSIIGFGLVSCKKENKEKELKLLLQRLQQRETLLL